MGLGKFIKSIFGSVDVLNGEEVSEPKMRMPEILDRARRYAESGETQNAFDLLDSALCSDPKNASAYYGAKGNIYDFELENHEEAVKCYKEVVKCLDKEFELDSIKPYFSEDEEANSAWRALHYLDRGSANYYADDFHAAINDYDKYFELNPDEGNIFLFRGEAYLSLGNFEKALADFTKYIEIEGEECDLSTYFKRAEIYTELGDWQGAAEDYTKVISLEKDDEHYVQGYFERGVIYLKQGSYNSALEDFSAEIRQCPERAEAYRKRAEAYRHLNLFEMARADDEKAGFYENQDKENFTEENLE